MIKLLENKIAVTPIYDPDRIGSIYIPDSAQERCDQGIVKYIGPDVKDIRIGDYVLFSGYTGTLVQIEDEGTVIIFPEEFATAILPDPPTTEIPGLYFKVRARQGDGAIGTEYIPATYEQAMGFIAEAFRDQEWRLNMLVRSKFQKKDKLENKPTISDYDRLR
jgi:Co-chaperonin GroES (HSP10)